MEYQIFIFALVMGLAFAILAFNKNGEVTVPIFGAFIVMVFLAFFNGYQMPEFSRNSTLLWLEAEWVTILGAFCGMFTAKVPKSVPFRRRLIPMWRLIVPVAILVAEDYLCC